MITPRLMAIINMIDKKTIADIGTDHAYIPITLALNGVITKAIASDKNKGPIDIAKNNVNKYGLDKIIELRIGAGLDPIEKEEVQCIIIAGMGGNLIGDIIEENLEKAKCSDLILQPMNAQYELRKRLHRLGFSIVKEELASEGFKVYNLMKVIWKPMNFYEDEIYLHLPGELRNHSLWNMLADKKEREFKKILDGQKKSENKDVLLIDYYEKLLMELNKLRNKI